jgi:anti-sigma-K factor RskA
MNNWHSQHLDDGLAMRYLDGELPARKARQVRKHLEACWQCRAEIEALEATVADCMRYRKQFLAAQMPEAPNPWADLTRGFDRIDAELSAEPFWKRLGHFPPSLMWSAAAVAVAVLVCAVYYQLRETPSVQAAVLLKKAVAAAESKPAVARRYRIRTRTAEVVRVGGAPLPSEMSATLAAAHYDTADPLSARSFAAWRDQLPEKQDSLSNSAPCPEVGQAMSPVRTCYVLETTTSAGDLVSATLSLRSLDLLPVESKLEFRDRNWIEFTDLSEVPDLHDGSPVAISGESPVRPAVPSRPAAIAPGDTASISDELQVLSALHGIGADLGDPVEVGLSNGRVEVSGVGVPPERQRKIREALESMPRVEVAFSDPGAAPAPVQATAPEPAPAFSPAPESSLQTRLEQRLGGRAELERFSSRVLDWDEAAMARAYAMRALAQRFPAQQESSMTPEDLRVLRRLAREHIDALQVHISGIEAALDPVLAGLGASAPAQPRPAAFDSWQPASEQVFRCSRKVELMLSLLLGVASGEKPSADLPVNLLAALADLRASAAECRRLLAQ